jgi:class 3 adenylate cyclase
MGRSDAHDHPLRRRRPHHDDTQGTATTPTTPPATTSIDGVVVVFSDLRGFTALAARLDAVEVHALLTAYYDVMAERVLAHGGEVAQVTGDEVLALFRIARDPATAVTAALRAARAMHAAVPGLNASLRARSLPALALGIGVHLGEVVTADVPCGGRAQRGLFGHVLNVGRRLCDAAEAGTTAVSADVVAATPAASNGGRVRAATMKGVAGVVLVTLLASDDPLAAPRVPATRRSADPAPMPHDGRAPRARPLGNGDRARTASRVRRRPRRRPASTCNMRYVTPRPLEALSWSTSRHAATCRYGSDPRSPACPTTARA